MVNHKHRRRWKDYVFGLSPLGGNKLLCWGLTQEVRRLLECFHALILSFRREGQVGNPMDVDVRQHHDQALTARNWHSQQQGNGP